MSGYDSFYSIFRFSGIPHYYGDYVRQLFLASAVLSFLAIPIWGDLLPFGTLAQVASGLIFVLLAGLTNPYGRIIMICNMLIPLLGVLLLQTAAISYYQSETFALFAVREAAAIMLLFIFYFSIKTLRAMSLGKIGKWERSGEFEDIGNK